MVTTLNLLLNVGNALCVTQMLNRTPNMLDLFIIVFRWFHVLLIKFVLKNHFYEPQNYLMQGILKGQNLREEYVLCNWY
jgi:hypothetical protein